MRIDGASKEKQREKKKKKIICYLEVLLHETANRKHNHRATKKYNQQYYNDL